MMRGLLIMSKRVLITGYQPNDIAPINPPRSYKGERNLFKELIDGVNEMSNEREAYNSIKQGLVEAIEVANGGVSIDYNPTTKLYDVMDNGELICSARTLPLAKQDLDWYLGAISGDNYE